ncbi:L,D-transpeptidase [Candidatus Roizmanbacteria bacterium]|nr:L,D-transpeptidase [Candidatus Roizmanbacteria bacterium]
MRKKLLVFGATFLLIVIVTVFIKALSPNGFCANQVSCIKNLNGLYDENTSIGEFSNKIVSAPENLGNLFSPIQVLGQTAGEKRLEINLSNQRLYAYQGEIVIYEFPISSGKWWETPTGTFNIWIKLRYTRMEGGNRSLGTYYNLPNVPYTMYFYNKDISKSMGYGVHGAYWHNNFGHPMSHGCVNMKPEDAEKIYSFVSPSSSNHTTFATAENPGTQIVIYGVTPKE